MSKQTIGVLLRSLVQLEDGGGTEFFGEPQFEIADLLRTAPDGRGVISLLELAAVQEKPRLFSTVLMWMLAELFEQLPEVGDLDKPKLVFFFDEAHLLFDDATDAFMESVERTVRMIRSKGVGVFFVTQHPTDIPSSVLAQLGNRVQHALRAFTPNDADALRKTVKTYPTSELYDLEELLTSLGIGEAAVTVLTRRAFRRRSSTPACARRARAWSRRRTWTRRRRPPRSGRSTARGSSGRALRRRSRNASRRRPSRRPSRRARRRRRRRRATRSRTS